MSLPTATRILALLVACSWPITQASAQSTDGYHGIQVFPVVVDTASFSQRFDFRTSQEGNATVEATFYPAQGTSQAQPLACPAFEVPWGGVSFSSLRALCPGLPAGSQFGFLMLTQTGTQNRPFTGFSRVSNPAGAGFAVEAFPAHTFTSALSTVAGLRRKAAGPGSPAFQTNCFVGLLGERDGTATSGTRVVIGLYDQQGQIMGDTAPNLLLLPGQMVRVLDIFSAVGLPPGDYDNAGLLVRVFNRWTPDETMPGVVSFCTVQENTSFGADFRISKQEMGLEGFNVIGTAAQDGHVSRDTTSFRDINTIDGSPGRSYSILPASGTQNTHVMYFRHPDWVACELVNPVDGQRLDTNSTRLEMRLVAVDDGFFKVLAGGHEITGWDRVYLGDKRERALGSNARYLIQVEDTEHADGPINPVAYGLHCESGSGHTPGDVISFQKAANDF